MKVSYKTSSAKRLLFFIAAIVVVLPSAIFLFRSSFADFKHRTAPSLKIKNTTIDLQNIYSDDLVDDIKASVSNYIDKIDDFWTFDQNHFYGHLKSKFEVVNLLDVRTDDQSGLHIKIVGFKPFCLVNNDLVLTEEQRLFPSKFFSKIHSLNLPNINIKNLDQEFADGYLCSDLHNFVFKISKEDWESFEIDYVNSSEIRLYPKNDELACILLSSTKTFFDQDKICKALQLYKKITMDKQLQKKLAYTRRKQLVLDTRFKSCIIARAEEEFREGGA